LAISLAHAERQADWATVAEEGCRVESASLTPWVSFHPRGNEEGGGSKGFWNGEDELAVREIEQELLVEVSDWYTGSWRYP
jgi:hypothetical protein